MAAVTKFGSLSSEVILFKRQVAANALLGVAFVLQLAAGMGREVGGLVGAGSAVADELAVMAKEANDTETDMPADARIRVWEVRLVAEGRRTMWVVIADNSTM